MGEPVTGNDFLRLLMIIVGIEVMLEAGPSGRIRQQGSIEIHEFLSQHHLISYMEGELFCGKTEGANCPILDLVSRRLPLSLPHKLPGGKIAIVEPEDFPGGSTVPPGGLFGKD